MDRTKRQFIVPCDCAGTCGALVVEYHDEQDADELAISISHLTSSWYWSQNTSWDNFIRSVKIIWKTIRGKEHYFYEIYIEDKKGIDEFKEFVANIDTAGMSE